MKRADVVRDLILDHLDAQRVRRIDQRLQLRPRPEVLLNTIEVGRAVAVAVF